MIESIGWFNSRKVILTGRGATALMLLYEILGKKTGRVILPAIGCPSLLATVLLSGLQPVIVDVDSNLNIEPGEVKRIIRPGDIVLGVHIFGIPCRIEELEKICDENNAILIEDAAQAVGGVLVESNRPLGTFGKASILSFAGGKILDTVGGGAILTHDPDLARALNQKAVNLPDRPNDISEKSKVIRDLSTNFFNDARKDNPDAASEWSKIYNLHPEIYYYSISDSEALSIRDSFEYFPENTVSRLDGVRLYESRLNFDGIRLLNYPDQCVPFRFSFIAEKLSGIQTQELTEKIRHATPRGIHASNLYLPLHWLAPDLVETPGCPNAEFAGTRIINLWLTDGFPARDIDILEKIISHYLKEL